MTNDTFETPEKLVRMTHKQFDKLFDENSLITKRELYAIVSMRGRLKKVNARYKTQIRSVENHGLPRSQAACESTEWAMRQTEALIRQLESLISKFISRHQLAPFVDATEGLSPVSLALMISVFDIKQAETCGRFWRWAGLDPSFNYTSARHKKELEVRSMLFMTSEALLKFNSFYRDIYYYRRTVEVIKNVNGEYTQLARRSIDRYEDPTRSFVSSSYKWASGAIDPEKVKLRLYGTLAPAPDTVMVDEGGIGLEMLPPLALHLRAQRYMVKVFLAHLHYCWYYLDRGNPPPKPYVLDLRNRLRIEVPPQFQYLT